MASPSSSRTWPRCTLPRGSRNSMPLQLLAVGELQRRARLQRPSLAVRERDETGLRHGQRVAAGRQFREIEHAAVVGQHAASARELRGGDEDARPLHRPPVVGRQHASGDAAGRRRRRVLRLRRRVARRLLAAARPSGPAAPSGLRRLQRPDGQLRPRSVQREEIANHVVLLDRKMASRIDCHDFFSRKGRSSRLPRDSQRARGRRTPAGLRRARATGCRSGSACRRVGRPRAARAADRIEQGAGQVRDHDVRGRQRPWHQVDRLER